MITQELLLRHPALVRTATIGCSWAGGPTGVMPQTSHEIVDAIASRDVERVLRVGYAATCSASYRADPAHSRPTGRRRWRCGCRRGGRMQFQPRSRTTRRRLAGVTAPTLVLHGTADEGISRPTASGSRADSGRPAGPVRRVGHLFWLEEPDRTVELLRELTKLLDAQPRPAAGSAGGDRDALGHTIAATRCAISGFCEASASAALSVALCAGRARSSSSNPPG